MRGRGLHWLDVFTNTPLAGNPLAIVSSASGLAGAAMQAIAAEFRLSETVFLFPPRDPVNMARLRIFTPTTELPFAGHPTIGAAALIALREAPDLLRAGEVDLVLEEEIGPVRCTVRQRKGDKLHARFEAPRLATSWGPSPDPAALATLLGLKASDIGGHGHRPTRFDAGLPFTFVPLANEAALAAARLRDGEIGAVRDAFYLYTPDLGDPAGNTVRARMLARSLGVGEDPATGSAAIAFAGALLANERLEDGEHDCRIIQGVEMGRRSEIGLAFRVRDGRLASTTIGGEVVFIAEGALNL